MERLARRGLHRRLEPAQIVHRKQLLLLIHRRAEKRKPGVDLLQIGRRVRIVEHHRKVQPRIGPHIAHLHRPEHPPVKRRMLAPHQCETSRRREIIRRHHRNPQRQERQGRIGQRGLVIGRKPARIDEVLPLGEQRLDDIGAALHARPERVLGRHMMDPDRAHQLAIDQHPEAHRIGLAVEIVGHDARIVHRHEFLAPVGLVTQPVHRVVDHIHAHARIFDTIQDIEQISRKPGHRRRSHCTGIEFRTHGPTPYASSGSVIFF